MPTYEYACTACGHRLEAVQSFSDDPLATCLECGGSLRKVYGNVGIVFKGSGFYKTDTRNGSSGNGKSSASADSPTSGGDSSNSDSSNSSDSSSSKETKAEKKDSASSSDSKGKKDSKSTAGSASKN